MTQTIPLLLHQIVPDDGFPSHLEGFSHSWREWNPDLQVSYWSEQELRLFVANKTPAYLPLFDSFFHPFCRIELCRYLLLQYYGGIVVDLDCQCLRPLSPLLQGRELLIALEPVLQRKHNNLLDFGMKELRRNAFMASSPRHPFWNDVLGGLCHYELQSARAKGEHLDFAGSFLLDHVLQINPEYKSCLVDEVCIYPFSREECSQGYVFDPAFWLERSSTAFVACYWDLTFLSSTVPEGWHAFVPSTAPANVSAPSQGKDKTVKYELEPSPAGLINNRPLISCLMITRNRNFQARLSIQSFLRQTYFCRELVVVDDDPDSKLYDWIISLNSKLIRYFRLPDQGLSLGELRNFSVRQSLGDYVCQWDDDDLYDPLRLEIQMATLISTGSDAIVLARFLIWWPQYKRLALSCYRDWEGSLLCRKGCLPAYPHLRQGEDSVLFEELRQQCTLARIDMPRLYLYIVHGRNTFVPSHFDDHWKSSTSRWQGDDLNRLCSELQRRLFIREYSECV